MAMRFDGGRAGTSGTAGRTLPRNILPQVKPPALPPPVKPTSRLLPQVQGPGSGIIAPSQTPRQPATGYSGGRTGGNAAGGSYVPNAAAGGGGSISPSATGSYGGYAAPPAAPPAAPNLDEFLATDDVYLTEKAGIDKDLSALIDELNMARGNYDIDFGKTLRNLGWRGNQPGMSIDDMLTKGSFDPMDRQGAYGNALNSQVNDFAGRGMMNSSFFGKAQEDLETGFKRQRDDLSDTRTQFRNDSGRQEKNARDQAEQALVRARLSGGARRASQYGIV